MHIFQLKNWKDERKKDPFNVWLNSIQSIDALRGHAQTKQLNATEKKSCVEKKYSKCETDNENRVQHKKQATTKKKLHASIVRSFEALNIYQHK